MFSAKIIFGPDVFTQFSAAEWNQLVEGGMTNTPFQRHAYQAAWWRHLGEGELLTVVVTDQEGALRGLAPFNLRNGRLVFNASKEETDYLDIVTRGADAEEVWEKIIDCLCSEDCPAWDVLDCYNIPADSPSKNILPRLASSRGFLFTEEVAEVCPVVYLEHDFEGYLAGLDKKQRHEIRRKMRRANGAEAALHLVNQEDDLTAQVDIFLDLLQKSTPEKGAWLNEGRSALFHEVAQAALADGTLLLMFMEMDGEAVSALFNFCYNGRVWVYNSGLDMTRFGHLSLGVVLTAQAIKFATENQCQTFDFLRGNEGYKYRFGAQDTVIYRVQVHRS